MITEEKETTCTNEMRSISSNNVFLDRFFGSFNWEEFACGCSAAFVNIGVTYPIYKIIFRQMLHGVPITSAFDQLRNEGLMFLYRGIAPPMAQKTISLSIMFGVFDGTRRYLINDFHLNAYISKIVAGVAAGTVETALLPLERVQTLLAHSKFHRYFANTQQAFRYVLLNHGFRELYRGIVPVLWRNGPSNALFFIFREETTECLPIRSKGSMQAMQEFISGAVIGASISTLFYPLNVIKVAMQSEMGHLPKSMWKTCLNIYNERGHSITYFYRGCMFNTARSFISWGIMNAAYEEFKNLVEYDILPN